MNGNRSRSRTARWPARARTAAAGLQLVLLSVNCTLQGCARSALNRADQPEDHREEQGLEDVTKILGTRVIVVRSTEGVSLPNGSAAPFRVRVAPLSEAEVGATFGALRTALAKYPPEMRRSQLEQIIVAGGLESDRGVRMGGTAFDKGIVVVGTGTAARRGSREVERTFHHEFSSVLLRANWALFGEQAWRSCNVADFEYVGSGAEAIREGLDNTEASLVLMERGFWCEYSMASLENDVNCLAASMFTEGRFFWLCAGRFDRLGKKVALLVEFYRTFDQRFGEGYFDD